MFTPRIAYGIPREHRGFVCVCVCVCAVCVFVLVFALCHVCCVCLCACLRPVSCVLNVLVSLECPYLIVPSVFSHVYQLYHD